MGIAGANVSGRGTNMRFCYLPEWKSNRSRSIGHRQHPDLLAPPSHRFGTCVTRLRCLVTVVAHGQAMAERHVALPLEGGARCSIPGEF